eukprot:6174443-Pleurochrysis_carterae.AAC.3
MRWSSTNMYEDIDCMVAEMAFKPVIASAATFPLDSVTLSQIVVANKFIEFHTFGIAFYLKAVGLLKLEREAEVIRCGFTVSIYAQEYCDRMLFIEYIDHLKIPSSNAKHVASTIRCSS